MKTEGRTFVCSKCYLRYRVLGGDDVLPCFRCLIKLTVDGRPDTAELSARTITVVTPDCFSEILKDAVPVSTEVLTMLQNNHVGKTPIFTLMAALALVMEALGPQAGFDPQTVLKMIQDYTSGMVPGMPASMPPSGQQPS